MISSENLWELRWFGVPQQDASTAVKIAHVITYSFEGNLFNVIIKGAQCALYQTVKKIHGLQEATFSTRLSLCAPRVLPIALSMSLSSIMQLF